MTTRRAKQLPSALGVALERLDQVDAPRVVVRELEQGDCFATSTVDELEVEWFGELGRHFEPAGAL